MANQTDGALQWGGSAATSGLAAFSEKLSRSHSNQRAEAQEGSERRTAERATGAAALHTLARLLARQAAREHCRRGYSTLTQAALLLAGSIVVPAILIFLFGHKGN